MSGRNDAIGIFDSGVGGLTVVRSVVARLPEESVVYLGDTARVPYGTKSADTVIRYARACAKILLDRRIKLLVVACNTASAFAVPALQDSLDVPVLGVVEPGARAVLAKSRSKKIGIIGTPGTIASGVYQRTLAGLDRSVKVFAKACPLFVPLAEEGWVRGTVPEAVAESYLNELRRKTIDTLLLGCTHYPLLSRAIKRAMGSRVSIVDSADATAKAVEDTLDAFALRCSVPMLPRIRYIVSDAPETFAQVGKRFLGRDLQDVEWVDF